MKEVQFETLMKASAKSYNIQKALIKKVLAGRKVNCQHCNGLVKISLPKDKKSTLYCQQGCTDIVVDFS